VPTQSVSMSNAIFHVPMPCVPMPSVESCPDPLTTIVKGKGNTYCANTLTGKFVGCVEAKCPEK